LRTFWSRKQVTSSAGLVGVAPSEHGVALVHAVHDEDGTLRIEQAEFARCDDPHARNEALAGLVASLGLTGASCISVLPVDGYALRRVSRPPVQDEELVDAARWLVQDLVDFDVTDAAISVFEFPEDAVRGREPTLYVAAVPPEIVREQVDMIEASGLVLQDLELPEFALRNLLEGLPDVVAGTAFLQLGEKTGLLAICHEQHLYLTRSVSTGTRQLEDALSDPLHPITELQEGPLRGDAAQLVDQLVLELQRSFDYYEAEMGKAPVSRLVIAPVDCEIAHLLPHIREQLNPISVEVLDLDLVWPSNVNLPSALQVELVRPLGAALRFDAAQQAHFTDAREDESEAPISFQSLLRITGIAVVCLAAASAFDAWETSQLQQRVLALRSASDERVHRIEQFRSEYPLPAPTEAYLRHVQALRDQSSAKARLYRELSSGRAQATSGFSSTLRALGRNTMKGLWLRHFEIREAGESLTIEGSALEPELVPKLLVELGSEPTFDGKRFRVFRIASSETRTGAVDFSLHSEAASEASP